MQRSGELLHTCVVVRGIKLAASEKGRTEQSNREQSILGGYVKSLKVQRQSYKRLNWSFRRSRKRRSLPPVASGNMSNGGECSFLLGSSNKRQQRQH